MMRNILTPWTTNSREPQPPHTPSKTEKVEPLLLLHLDWHMITNIQPPWHPEPQTVVNPNLPHVLVMAWTLCYVDIAWDRAHLHRLPRLKRDIE